jgi:hypothetical protein
MTTLREAAEIGHDYIHDALTSHTHAYGNHPAMKPTRDSILADLEAVQKALSQPSEIEAAVLAEREACAELCENIGDYDENVDEYYSDIYATAIRARGEK